MAMEIGGITTGRAYVLQNSSSSSKLSVQSL